MTYKFWYMSITDKRECFVSYWYLNLLTVHIPEHTAVENTDRVHTSTLRFIVWDIDTVALWNCLPLGTPETYGLRFES